MKKIIFALRSVCVVIIYWFGVIIFGEKQPFSKFPMYSSFANWSYVFYITDTNNLLVPCKNLHTTGGDLGHSFYAICEEKNIAYGNGLESSLELRKVGFEMMKLVLNKPENSKMLTRKLRLWRRYFYYKNDSILHLNQLIYESNLE